MLKIKLYMVFLHLLGISMERFINYIFILLYEIEIFVINSVGNVHSHHYRRLFYLFSGMGIGRESTMHTGPNFY